MEKPINLKIEDFRNEIIRLTNSSELPLFTLDSIFRDLTNEIHKCYVEQIEKDREKWEEEINKGKEAEKGE